jgi:hypothetical protein
MYKTDPDKTAKILNALRPSLVFVTVPFAIQATKWIEQFKNTYSLINANKLLSGDGESRLFKLIQQRMLSGKVMAYGFVGAQTLDKIMPEEYAHVWFYPNNQTTYLSYVKKALESESVLNDWSGCLPESISNSDGSKAITIAAHKHQKKVFGECLKKNERIFIVLV